MTDRHHHHYPRPPRQASGQDDTRRRHDRRLRLCLRVRPDLAPSRRSGRTAPIAASAFVPTGLRRGARCADRPGSLHVGPALGLPGQRHRRRTDPPGSATSLAGARSGRRGEAGERFRGRYSRLRRRGPPAASGGVPRCALHRAGQRVTRHQTRRQAPVVVLVGQAHHRRRIDALVAWHASRPIRVSHGAADLHRCSSVRSRCSRSPASAHRRTAGTTRGPRAIAGCTCGSITTSTSANAEAD